MIYMCTITHVCTYMHQYVHVNILICMCYMYICVNVQMYTSRL